MIRRPNLTILLVLAAVGCAGKRAPEPSPALPIVGFWSDHLAGIRCRMRVASIHVNETGTVITSLEVLNTSSHTVKFDRPGNNLNPVILWCMGRTIFLDKG